MVVAVLVSCAGFHGSPIFEATGISNVKLPILMNPALSHLKLPFELEATHGMGQSLPHETRLWVFILPQPDIYRFFFCFLKNLFIYLLLI